MNEGNECHYNPNPKNETFYQRFALILFHIAPKTLPLPQLVTCSTPKIEIQRYGSSYNGVTEASGGISN